MQTDNFLVKFGDNIRSLRLKQNMSQEELAAKAGVHRTYIGMIERGEKNATLDSIRKLAEALGLEPHELLKFNGAKQ
jgi:transcriptional regulator with XRE-family HTH domain